MKAGTYFIFTEGHYDYDILNLAQAIVDIDIKKEYDEYTELYTWMNPTPPLYPNAHKQYVKDAASFPEFLQEKGLIHILKYDELHLGSYLLPELKINDNRF